MRHQRRWSRALSVTPVAVVIAVSACQLIAGSDRALPGPAPGLGCLNDGECNTGGACSYSRCDVPTGTCLPATPLSELLFARFRVDLSAAPLACKTDITPCVAARYPYLYLGTEDGPARVTISDPSVTSAAITPIGGLAWKRTTVLAGKSTVYFTSPEFTAPDGGGAAAWPLGFLLPADSAATSASIATPDNAAAITPVPVPPGNDLLLLAYTSGRGYTSAALVRAPLRETKFEAAGFGGGLGAEVAGASGTRTLFHAAAASGASFKDRFLFADSLSAPQARQLTGFVDIDFLSSGISRFAAGDDGSILWLTTLAPDGTTGSQLGARFSWLVDGFSSLLTDASRRLDLGAFQPALPAGIPSIGPVAWIDAQTAIVVAQDSATKQAAISLVSRAGLPPQEVPGARRIENIPLGVSSTFVTSHGYAYLVSLEGGPGTVEVRAFAPACQPR